MEQLYSDLIATAPISGLTVTALAVILVNAFSKESERLQYWLAMIGLAGNLLLAGMNFPTPGRAFNGMVLTGGYASIFTMLFLVAAALTFMSGRPYLRKIGTPYGEFYILTLITTIGMIVFASSIDLITSFLGLEIMSICLYVLAGFSRGRLASNEASLKYFLLGAFASGFFLYGIALVYGATGSTNLSTVAVVLQSAHENLLLYLGFGLLLVGFAFKIGAAPFHVWVPDVYEGSPTVSTAFMSTGAKAAAFAALTVVFTHALNFSHNQVTFAISILAVASMVVGNVLAIAQSNVKRMLAYSSIAHAGYLLIGTTTGGIDSINAIIFYLTSYVVTNLGAFGVLSTIENADQTGVDLPSLTGLAKRQPVLAVLMSIFMFSLIGLPPFSGFFGKYYIFISAIKQGYTWLAIIGVVMSVVSVYYYLRVIVVMYFNESTEAPATKSGAMEYVPLVISAALILLLGLMPSVLLTWFTRLFMS